MVVREFLVELEKTQAAFVWQYLHDNRIRGFLRMDRTRTAFDPIAAVAMVKSGQAVAMADTSRVADAMGLSGNDVAAIADAADDMLWKQVDGQTVLDGYCEWLRDGIALATGLEPYEPAPESTSRQVSTGPELVAESTLRRERV
jgi:hypothetical protein